MVQFVAGGLILSSVALYWMMGHDSWGQFIYQMRTGAGVGIQLTTIAFGLALGVWDKRAPTPVR